MSKSLYLLLLLELLGVGVPGPDIGLEVLSASRLNHVQIASTNQQLDRHAGIGTLEQEGCGKKIYYVETLFQDTGVLRASGGMGLRTPLRSAQNHAQV